MALKASDFPKRKKEQLFVEGYEIDCANDITPGFGNTEETFHFFGASQPVLDNRVDNGTLSIALLEKRKANNKFLDVLHRYDPDDTSTRKYNWESMNEVTVWVNRKNAAGTQYEKAIVYPDWMPTPGLPTGAAKDPGVRTFAGNCEVPQEFTQPIIAEKIAVSSGAGGYTGTLSKATPLEIPVNTGKYAVKVLAIEETRSGNTITKFNTEDIEIKSSTVTSGGAVTIAQSDLDEIGGPNYVYVLYLYDKSQGIHPDDISPDGLLKKIS